MAELIPTRKMKGEEIDFYDCRECGKRWKQTDKKIGHTKVGCKRFQNQVYVWSNVRG